MSHASLPHMRRLVNFGLLDQGARASLTNVSAQLFPLFADRKRLQSFLDHRYNDTLEGSGVRLDLVSPVVLFAVLYYPTMHAYDRAEAGILKQDEYYYLVPVRMTRKVDGRVYEELGVVTPYIYVTSPISTPVGRELFGWQKAMYKVSSVIPRGARLTAHEPYLVVKRPIPGRRGAKLQYEPVVELRYRNDANAVRLGGLSTRLLDVAKELPSSATLLYRTLVGELNGNPLRAAARAKEVSSIIRSVLMPNEALNVYSMPQVPHPSVGWRAPNGDTLYGAAFQGLMRTQLRVRHVREVALLGSSPTGLADPSRGFSIRVRGHGVGQVVSRLGLQVAGVEGDNTDDERPQRPSGVEASVLHPFGPLGARFDLEVDGLDVVAQRTIRSKWYDGEGRVLGPPPKLGAAPYNTFLGPSSAEGYSSYARVRHAHDYRILAMGASLERLKHVCHRIAPTPPSMTLTPREVRPGEGAVVAVMTRLPPSQTPRQELEWFAGMYVNLAIVADLSWQGRSRMVFLETHGFTDNPHAFLVGRELLAANRWLMEVDESPQQWVPNKNERRAGRHLLSVTTSALTTLNAGERVEMRPFLDVVECDTVATPDRTAFEPLVQELFAERELSYLRVSPVRTVSPDDEIVPALVRGNIELVRFARAGESVPSPTWLGAHDLYIHPYASMPIVEQLGLKARRVGSPPFERRQHLPRQQRVSCDFALGGHLPATRRGVLTLYEWSRGRWTTEMAEWFFGDERPLWEGPVP